MNAIALYLSGATRRTALVSAGACPAAAGPAIAPAVFDERGFTLIEMVVVTALISIMLVVAIPRLNGSIFADSGDETARWIIANVRQAKESAVIQQKVYLLTVSLDTQQLWIAPADLAETEAVGAREKGYRLPRGVKIDYLTIHPRERLSSGTIPIAFYPQGYSDKAIIHIRTNAGERLSAHIEPFLPGVHLARDT